MNNNIDPGALLAQEQTVLEEAQDLIYGNRQGDYGPPTVSFESIAGLWDAYLNSKEDVAVRDNDNEVCAHCGLQEPNSWELDAIDVAHMMILLKISRNITGGYKRDSVVDGAGYFGCIERIVEGK